MTRKEAREAAKVLAYRVLEGARSNGYRPLEDQMVGEEFEKIVQRAYEASGLWRTNQVRRTTEPDHAE